MGGAGELDDETLRKALAGKQVNVQTGIGETTEFVSANGSARDIETMLQLIYLKMAQPRKDAEIFKVWQANTASALEDQLRDPSTQFRQKSTDVLYKGNVRRQMPTAADVKKVDQDKALAFYSDRFGDATDFTFVIVGAVDPATLKPLVEQYLASLPAKGRVEKEKDPKNTRVTGVVKKSWNFGTEPKAQVQIQFHGTEKWTRDTERDLDILSNILGKRLRETMREDLGGVYGVGAYGWLTRVGKTERTFVVSFGCDPDRVDELVKAVQTVSATLVKEGPTEAELAAAKETYLRDRERGMKTNGFWVNWLGNSYHFGDDPELILDTAPRLARYSAANVKAAAKKFVSTKQYYQAVMLPVAGTKSEASPGVQPPKQ
jgi:zinc protease